MSKVVPIFDPDRLRNYPLIMLAIFALSGIWLVYSAEGMVDPFGKPLGYDFITFWSAGQLTLQGQAEAAFDFEAIFAAQRAVVPGSETVYLWHYPPTFQLVAAGLALLPYVASYFVFVGATLLVYVLMLRRLLDQPHALLLLLAFPGVYVCVFHGQNSLLTVALMAGAAYYIGPRPILAGIFIGLLSYKPQLGLLYPLVLMVTGQWRAFLSAAVTTLAFAGLATAVFGLELWQVFFENATIVRHVMEQGMLPWAKMPTFFIFLRMFTVPQELAYVLHGFFAVGIAAFTVWLWWRCGATRLAHAALVCAALLILPYAFDYELALLALPLAVLATDMAYRDGDKWEKAVLVLAYVAPFIIAGIGERTPLQLGFPAVLALFVLSAVRALRHPRQEPL